MPVATVAKLAAWLEPPPHITMLGHVAHVAHGMGRLCSACIAFMVYHHGLITITTAKLSGPSESMAAVF